MLTQNSYPLFPYYKKLMKNLQIRYLIMVDTELKTKNIFFSMCITSLPFVVIHEAGIQSQTRLFRAWQKVVNGVFCYIFEHRKLFPQIFFHHYIIFNYHLYEILDLTASSFFTRNLWLLMNFKTMNKRYWQIACCIHCQLHNCN